MLSPDALKEWQERLNTAVLRHKEAERRVAETAIERLHLPRPDGYFAHTRALQDETEALRAYKEVLAEYARLIKGGEPAL
jgi:hypothetical protein